MLRSLGCLLLLGTSAGRRTDDRARSVVGPGAPRAERSGPHGGVLLQAGAEGASGSAFPFGNRFTQIAPIMAAMRRRGDTQNPGKQQLAPAPALPGDLVAGRSAGTALDMRARFRDMDPEFADDGRPPQSAESLHDMFRSIFGGRMPRYPQENEEEAMDQLAEIEEMHRHFMDFMRAHKKPWPNTPEQDEELFEEWLGFVQANGIGIQAGFAPGTERRDSRDKAGAKPLVSKLAVDETGVVTSVNLPTDWAKLFVDGTLRPVWIDEGRCEILVAECATDPGVHLAVKIMSSEAKETKNDIKMMQMLRQSGNVVSLLGSQDVGPLTFLLMPAAQLDLEQWLRYKRETQTRFSTPEESLPMLIDLLRGIKDLGDVGIVHPAIEPSNILLKDGRPLISDFASAVIIDKSDLNFGTGSMDNLPRMNQFVLPPETIRGLPTGGSNMVWQVGLIFFRILFGYLPTESAVWRIDKTLMESDWTPEVDDVVQDIIRNHFFIEEEYGCKAFLEEHEDIRKLLEGMLEVDPEDRWDAAKALREAETVARRRSIKVPAERQPPVIIMQWHSDWE